ncbi:exopolyphosphatase / guanosine-5'-triphosphate,3'-diphosphate pyrophosphatase [Nitratiruptor sp. YY09-18]|nr:exopolyphosphatase / guanosine-5'-triphosphate,3'-diphosphate pyrophosphatase [Nitratiruptor sp. YY09-18]
MRISEGAYENGGNLQSHAMERAFNALREFLHIAHHYNTRKILCVATSAVRDAPNKHEFLHRIKKELGLNIKVIDGKTEALLGAIAASNLLPIEDGVTIDIGGGSTELALIQKRRVIDTVSLDLGTVRLKELFFDNDAPIKQALAFIHNELAKIPPHFTSKTAVGIGGTIRALSKAIMAKNKYPLDKVHGFAFSISDEKKFIDKLISAPVLKLKKFHIKKDRYDTIKEGTLIFREVLKTVGAKDVITSGAGVREGVFLKDLLRNSNYLFPHNFEPSVKSLLDRFCIDEKTQKCHYRLSKKLYEALYSIFDERKEYEKVLLIAAKLLNIGIKVEFYEHHKHSSYIVLNDLQYNLTHKEIVTIAALVRFHKRKLPNEGFVKTFRELLPHENILNWLSFILSLAETLNKDLTCPNIAVSFADKKLHIHTTEPLYLAKEEIKNLQKPAAFAILFD